MGQPADYVGPAVALATATRRKADGDMGSFFGKGKVKPNEESKLPVPPPARASRRAVIPGAAPSTQRVSAPGTAPVNRGPGNPAPSVFAKPKAPAVQAKAPDSSDSDQLVLAPGESPVRPDTKGPIRSSNAPQFAGSLTDSARTSGPCRTGDAALIEFMVNKAKLITPEQAKLITSKAQRETLAVDAAAVLLQVITEDALVNALTQECWVPHLKVDKYEIRKKALDTVSREDAVHFSVFPVDKLGQLLTLAMVNPLDADTIRLLESKTNLDIKRVVATRSEIQQGIEKYYSGKVIAKDTSISFTADASTELKSVTQMLGNVKASDADTTLGGSDIPSPIMAGDNIISDIQDIDDLLTADEIIAPAIIEAKPFELEAPLIVPIGEIIEISEPQIIDASALEARAPRTAGLPPLVQETRVEALPPFTFDDTPSSGPAALRPPAAFVPPATTRISAAEFELDDTDAIAPAIKPATEAKPADRTPIAAPRQRALPLPQPTPIARPATSSIARPATASVARPVTTSISRPSSGQIARPPGSSSNLFPARTATGRVANPKVVNLIPVLEEEFQHAITHGKAHVFEKWVGLQGRNRIINAVPVDAEFDQLLEGVFV